jgi:hypothetical protein
MKHKSEIKQKEKNKNTYDELNSRNTGKRRGEERWKGDEKDTGNCKERRQLMHVIKKSDQKSKENLALTR